MFILFQCKPPVSTHLQALKFSNQPVGNSLMLSKAFFQSFHQVSIVGFSANVLRYTTWQNAVLIVAGVFLWLHSLPASLTFLPSAVARQSLRSLHLSCA